MNDKVDLLKVELEGLDLVDFGNAAEETRQQSPIPFTYDSLFGMGEWGK